jgi:hypothetical protein
MTVVFDYVFDAGDPEATGGYPPPQPGITENVSCLYCCFFLAIDISTVVMPKLSLCERIQSELLGRNTMEPPLTGPPLPDPDWFVHNDRPLNG